MRKSVKLFSTLASIAVLAEFGIRGAGLISFPLYEADNEIGYVLKPNQSGQFLRANKWAVNSLSMSTGPFQPSSAQDILLIGDSIVHGGNPYKEQERLGPQLQLVTGMTVWPVAAPSWTLLNELRYLQRYPEVLQSSDSLVFVLNSEDFDEATSWSCETTHPRSSPTLATLYVVKKHIFDWSPCGPPPAALRVPSGDWKPILASFVESEVVQARDLFVFLYPDKNEAEDSILQLQRLESKRFELQALGVSNIFNVGLDPRWSRDLYKDEIHPTPRGMEVLAAIIASVLRNPASLEKR